MIRVQAHSSRLLRERSRVPPVGARWLSAARYLRRETDGSTHSVPAQTSDRETGYPCPRPARFRAVPTPPALRRVPLWLPGCPAQSSACRSLIQAPDRVIAFAPGGLYQVHAYGCRRERPTGRKFERNQMFHLIRTGELYQARREGFWTKIKITPLAYMLRDG